MEGPVDRPMDGWTTDGPTDGLADRPMDRPTDGPTDELTDRPMDGPTDGHGHLKSCYHS